MIEGILFFYRIIHAQLYGILAAITGLQGVHGIGSTVDQHYILVTITQLQLFFYLCALYLKYIGAYDVLLAGCGQFHFVYDSTFSEGLLAIGHAAASKQKDEKN